LVGCVLRESTDEKVAKYKIMKFFFTIHRPPIATTPGAFVAPTRVQMSDERGDDDDDGRSNIGVVAKPRLKVKKPSMYKVLMLNDDYTPMEFVIHVLERFFGKGAEEASQVMLQVHQKGVGICGVFTFEIAETKVNQTMELARKNQHPLQCTLEKE
jgi:ATP-dependent Clp protease adaptor protein ClpS